MTPRDRILVTKGELEDLQTRCGTRGYVALPRERLARILEALELGATACERSEALARTVVKLRGALPR